MSSLENALRGALAKGDQSDPIFRRRVYEAAANAMQKSLETRGAATPDALKQQNLRLADAIKTIEAGIKAEKEQGVEIPLESAPEVQDEVPAAGQAAPVIATATRGDPTLSADEPTLVAEPRSELRKAAPPSKPVQEKRKPRPFARLLVACTAIAFLGIGLLWIINTGAFQSAEERDTSVPNPAQVLEPENFEGRDPGTATAPKTLDASEAISNEWVSLFTPADPTTLSLVDGATAEVSSDSRGDFARLVTPSEVAEVQIDVPLGVLRGSGGKPLQLSLRVRSDEGAPTQMSVTCDFGAAGDCGRHRFNVGQAENEFLIQINLDNAQSATAPGRINLITDMQGGGKAVKLLEARVRAVDE